MRIHLHRAKPFCLLTFSHLNRMLNLPVRRLTRKTGGQMSSEVAAGDLTLVKKRSIKKFLIYVFLFLGYFIQLSSVEASYVASLSQKLAVDSNTGAASTSIPIVIPTGRTGMQPNLSLIYNSNSPNDMLGVGWLMDLGGIQRSTKNGAPHYDNTDTFIFTQGGSRQELVDGSGNGTAFVLKVDDGSALKFQFINSSYWQVTDKKGTKYIFGQDVQARVATTDSTAKVFKWMLQSVADVHGNTMDVWYSQHDGLYYPLEVDYTGSSTQSTSPFIKVHFDYEARPDVIANYAPGLPIILTQRLSSITSTAHYDNFNSYKLTYTQAPGTNESLLTSVTQYGSDGISALPTIKFTYSTTAVPTFGASYNVNSTNSSSVSLGQGTAYFMDMNGDGLVDLVDAYYNRYLPNDGSGNFNPVPINLVNVPPSGMPGGPYNHPGQFADLNGDGLVDIIVGTLVNAYTRQYSVYINNGVNGYNAPITISNLTTTNPIQFADMNGDGLPDVIETVTGSSKYNYATFNVYTNKGNGDFNTPVTSTITYKTSTNAYMSASAVRFVDVNGDGMADAIYPGSTTLPVVAWLNNGSGTLIPNQQGLAGIPGTGFYPNGQLVFADMNGDGLVDIVKNAPDQYTGYQNAVLCNNGQFSFIPCNSTVGYGAINAPGVQILDINGDGYPDFVYTPASDPWTAWINDKQGGVRPAVTLSQHHATLTLNDPNMTITDINGDGLPDMLLASTAEPYKAWIQQPDDARSPKVNVLVKIDNSIGGTTEIQYGVTNIGSLQPTYYNGSFTPAYINTVQSVTAKSAQGDRYTTSYVYKKGMWNFPNREFRGFGYVKIVDADGNYTETNYLQDDIYKGHIKDQSTFDAAGNLYGKVVNTWNSKVSANTFVYLQRVDNFIYDGNATGKRTAEEYVYSQTPLGIGNVNIWQMTKLTQYGEVDLNSGADIGSDTRTVETTYGNNPTYNLYELPQTIVVRDNSGNIVRQSWYYYDGATDPNMIPNNWGRLTAKKEWAGPTATVHPVTQYGYDPYGNLVSTTDPNGNVTTITYDLMFSIFPVSVANALGQVTQSEYYGVNVPIDMGDGYKGLWGQLKSTTDANNNQAKNSYDVFGRPVFSVGPLDSVSFPTTMSVYALNPQYTKITSQQRITSGQAGTIDAYQFSDGLGRVIQTKSPSATSGQYVVNSQTTYTSRGLPSRKYVPFFSINPVDTIESVDLTRPSTQLLYDAMGRLIKAINPDGTYSTYIYDDWTSTTIDENGHQQKSYYDAYGRLIKKEEYSGADGRSPNYPSSLFTLYATTQYSYDSEGNLIKTSDDKGNTTTMTYDTLGRKIAMSDPDMGNWQYSYDLNGNLVYQIDAKGQRIDFTYDALNRLTNKRDAVGMNVNYSYDALTVANSKGRLTQAQYTNGNTQFSYDQVGREIKSVKTINPVSYAVQRTYNDLGGLTSMQYPNTTNLSYTFNSAGQIQTIKDLTTSSNYVNSVSYNEAGQPTQTVFGNSDTTINTYDPKTFRLTNIQTTDKTGASLQNLSYTYDSVGNILSINDAKYTGSQTFQYDHLNRLTQATSSKYGTKTFSYDTIGNLILKDGLTYTYGLSGKIPHAVTSLSDGTAFTYDANGNMAKKSKSGVTTTYTYDTENHLKTVVQGWLTIDQFEYDGDGGRTKKIAQNGPAMTTTRYIGKLYEETGNLQIKHIFLGGQEVASVTKNTSTLVNTVIYYHPDHLGGTNVTTNSAGQIRELCEYLPFGGFSRHDKYGSSEEVAWFYFTGKKLDEEAGLYYFGARYYDPGLGRFITPDTIVQNPGNPQTLNRYTYCNNNPVNLIDPTGHKWSWTKFWHSAVGAVLGVVAAVVLGPGGLALVGSTMAWAIGGAVGGALTGGLNDGWRGALMGGVIGGALGGLGGWAGGLNNALGDGILTGMFVGGVAITTATDSWDSFAGGLVGGVAGSVSARAVVNSATFKAFKSSLNGRQQTVRVTQQLKVDQTPRATKIYKRGEFGQELQGAQYNGKFYPAQIAKGGEPAFRAFDNKNAFMKGQSWTPLDPRNVENFGDIMGLPPENSAGMLVGGRLRPGARYVELPASPVGSNQGGGVEWLLDNPQWDVTVELIKTWDFRGQ